MIIKRIELNNFRNYKKLEISFDEKTNILYGKNAQGKTNLLEAAYLCATTKSHKGSKDVDMIRKEKNESHLATFVEKDGIEYRIDVHLKAGRSKGVALNRVPLKRATELFGIVNVIFFSPEDLDIVKRGPDVRRRFLDMELCQIDKIYLNDLTIYKKALSQRNKLLKDIGFNKDLMSILSVWDERLVFHGKRIIDRRKRFISELSGVVEKKYERISSNRESLKIFYEPNTSADDFYKAIEDKKWNDIRFGQTTVGPHRDDMGLQISDLDVKKFGSQGQQRSSALSLKLAEIEIMEEYTKQKPVLLLDDVLSELDTDRQRELLFSLDNIQTIMTCTGIEEIKESGLKTGKVMIVDDAKIHEAD